MVISGSFQEALQNLEDLGLSDVLLPFLLVFTIIFAVLQKTNILGKDKRNWNIIVALVISLSVVIPHVTGTYPADGDIVTIMNHSLPNVSIVIVAIVMFLILIGLLGGEAKWMGGSLSGWIVILSAILVFFIFGRSAGWFETLPNWLQWLDNSETQALIIVILVFGIIIWFITKDDKKEGPRTKFMSDIGDFFKGK
ncbi:MAG: hypothetical protein V1837_02420 [Candidatus Woesearchaeota archaeon]